MKLAVLLIISAIVSSTANAESLVAARTIRSETVITPADLALSDKEFPGSLNAIDAAVGLEARINIYAGRPISANDLGPAALIERNQVVVLIFERRGLNISTDARALTRAAEGEIVRVMNLSSRTTVNGLVQADGTVMVGQSF